MEDAQSVEFAIKVVLHKQIYSGVDVDVFSLCTIKVGLLEFQ